MIKRGVLHYKECEASWSRRIFAYCIDFILVNILFSIPFGSLLREESEHLFSLTQNTNPKLILASIVVTILIYAYFVITEFKVRQSLGKLLLGIQVHSLKKEISLSQILIRNISKPFPFVLFIDALYAWLKGGKQRLLERFSRTAVVLYQLELR